MVGIGSGDPLDRTHKAERAIANASVIVGYHRYVQLIEDLCAGKQIFQSGMRKERDRCRIALEQAACGSRVALISSGDPGIYGMAGLLIETAHHIGSKAAIEIIPGVTAGSSMAARLGAPLMLDFACISLSDLLLPWQTIRHRLEHVALADLVCVLYNPRSMKRRHQLDDAVSIFLEHRPGTTPAGVATAIGTQEEQVVLTTLDRLLENDIGMRSTIVVGNTKTTRLDNWLVTPRGYSL